MKNQEGDEARTEAKEEKKGNKIIARELRSPALNLIVSTNRHSSHARKNPRTLTAIAQLSDASVTSVVTFQYLPSWRNTHTVDTSNAFCKLFVVIN
jgi:hypothetical protein